MPTIQTLRRQPSEAKTVKDLWKRTILGVSDEDKDIPLAWALLNFSAEISIYAVLPVHTIRSIGFRIAPQLSAVILLEEVESRQIIVNQEALDRQKLSKELSESEMKFERFATRAPLGLEIIRPDGLPLSANDIWKEPMKLNIGSDWAWWREALIDGEFEMVSNA
ncbi:uncharacterized protein BP5553_05755 [Venustampulla echinocandica]|uniref:Uncharacterized protein n=1 Tax=Venustampulla echinocandica TaxID=2656787 RepID=A0A370TLK2_9HELO|nr:uncharacterized protein BP5553_05755 [Venustampulla echinocandica]RDL36403.1 hypothetical protein BP5553_05755 [Venustampulla echinocandica]